MFKTTLTVSKLVPVTSIKLSVVSSVILPTSLLLITGGKDNVVPSAERRIG